MNETMSCMRQHVSVRSYTDQPIDLELLQQLIGCGQDASSSSFIQAYSVIRVCDEENRRVIARAAGNQRWIVQAAEFLVFCADMQRISYCCEKEGQGELEGYTEHFITATIDTALMAQNVLLAAESIGLGGVFIGGIRNDPEVVCECLQIPQQVYPAFAMCLGWPADKNEHKPRFPLHSILHEDRYHEEDNARHVDDYDRNMSRYYAARQGQLKRTDWSKQTAMAVQGKKREHMMGFLQQRGFLLR